MEYIRMFAALGVTSMSDSDGIEFDSKNGLKATAPEFNSSDAADPTRCYAGCMPTIVGRHQRDTVIISGSVVAKSRELQSAVRRRELQPHRASEDGMVVLSPRELPIKDPRRFKVGAAHGVRIIHLS